MSLITVFNTFEDEQIISSGNGCKPYSVGARFEFQPGHLLPFEIIRDFPLYFQPDSVAKVKVDLGNSWR
jgi:hypothetical protein